MLLRLGHWLPDPLWCCAQDVKDSPIEAIVRHAGVKKGNKG